MIDVNVTWGGQYCSASDVKLSEQRSAARPVNDSTVSPKTIRDTGRDTPKAIEAIVANKIPNNSTQEAYRN